jgi:hypothetical protein
MRLSFKGRKRNWIAYISPMQFLLRALIRVAISYRRKVIFKVLTYVSKDKEKEKGSLIEFERDSSDFCATQQL